MLYDTTLDPHPSAPPDLGAYAHIRREEHLLVTGWERAARHEFDLDLVWPAVQGDLPYDPRVLAQTIRQTGLVVAHGAYDVPLAHQTVLSALSFTVPAGPPLPRGRTTTARVRVAVDERAPGRRTRRTLRMTFHVQVDGATLARAESEFGWIPERVYERVRGVRRHVEWGAWPVPDPVDARTVGRTRPAEVVLAAADRPGRWLLRNDTGDHQLFDHPVDHVPGLALLEAADQAARALCFPRPPAAGRIDALYRRYVEFDLPCLIEAEPLAEPGAVRVTGTQDGDEAFRVDFRP
ncbi:ScbA/BarX family gamma-butyrolactone biosynthesis protein [Streptomyces fradiae]|uniref:ScbA/BarX family gamma-butyrolactone biosynthesis protein n=1 Tax=Streptomyces fradiae TaxID=1906 RepID=UPI0036BD80B3